MQRKIIIDTCVYIDIFKTGRYREIVNPFVHVTFLAHPVLHELWMGIKGRKEARLLTTWQNTFVRLKRLIIPSAATLILIGRTCHALRLSGKLNPVHPKHYNDITIAALARQVGATVFTNNTKDFLTIQKVIDFDVEDV